MASVSVTEREAFLSDLKPHELRGLPYLFEFWALPHQLPPEGDWRTWVILGGRGAGKTRAGAEWVRAQVEGATPTDAGRCSKLALIGETYAEARNIMVFGDSGIIACSPPDRCPVWNESNRSLTWPNGATAEVFSASSSEALRGPQFDGVWMDELAKWKNADEAWKQIQFTLRLGAHPQQVVTTTPKNVPILKRILARKTTVKTTATTWDNAAHLADGFLEVVGAEFAGTRTGRQELEGEILEDLDGALWTPEVLHRVHRTVEFEPDRIVVAVDPSVTSRATSDACGIVVVGAKTTGPATGWHARVLEDASVVGKTPMEWANAAVAAYHRHGASRIVAEVNQGGDLVEQMIGQADPLVSYRAVRAKTGKVGRAEPVAALYEQGRVSHVRGLAALEDQMRLMTTRGYEGPGSPDRVDALVWALTDLMLKPFKGLRVSPRVRDLGA